jgi:hypothetical protein
MGDEKFQSCIDTCLECANQCDYCILECLKEENIKVLVQCIRLNRECAQMCLNTARTMTLGSEHYWDVCKVCADYCDRCVIECEKRTYMDCCRLCVEICKRCADECRKIKVSA